MIGNIGIDYVGEMEHQSIEVGFILRERVQ